MSENRKRTLKLWAFNKLTTSEKWAVIGVIAATLIGLLSLILVRLAPNRIPIEKAGQPNIQNQVIGMGNNVLVAHGNIDVRPEEKFVRRAFLKQDADGQLPRVLTIRPGKKAEQAKHNANLDITLHWLVRDGFFCPVGTEVELLPAEIGNQVPVLAVIDTFHTKVRVLAGDNKGMEGWILTKLIEWKLERQ